jgi:threonyl-tRNA synthetase
MYDADKNSQDELYRVRHSLAHVMAQAVLEMRPGSKRGFGPPIDDGFYYDFILSRPLSPTDFPEIESRMRRIIASDQQFACEELDAQDAMVRLNEMGEPFKAEYAEELVGEQSLKKLTFYRNGPFVDMCSGPHVSRTSQLPPDAFKIRSLAGAYWRGDERQPMMTRIYAWAYRNREELERHVQEYERRQAFDHKKLGAALDIFALDPLVGKGLVLWLPNGTAIREELEKLAKEQEFKRGYVRVATPHITREDLYRLSGHLAHYRDKMYPPMVLEEHGDATEPQQDRKTIDRYYLKPMNCPHHHRIFAARPRSYRDLPLRLAEYGEVYRYEGSGEISGLLRVRGMDMNDAHIYCTKEQIKEELKAVLDLQEYYFQLFRFKDYYLRLSLWDAADPKRKEKYVNRPELWAETEDLVRQALTESDVPFIEAKGEAAFYGPKIDIQFRTVTGREETFCTVQLDFAVPAPDRMNLVYTAVDGKGAHPYVIHRAPLGTHERFIAYLIEHFGGAFPTWLAPVQVRVLPISEKVHEYAHEIVLRLRAEMIRAEMDDSGQPLGKKVREAQVRKIPIALVIGEKEHAERSVTVRRYGEKDQPNLHVDAFMNEVLLEIRERRMRHDPAVFG